MGENKELFVQALQAAFVAGDPQRYGHLAKEPVEYVECRGRETILYRYRTPQCPVDVTGCSCAAIAHSFIDSFL